MELLQLQEENNRLRAELEKCHSERIARLEAVNRELESFSYSVSHDLRAPLRYIDAFSKLLAENYAGQLDEQGHGYIRRVVQGVERMRERIDAWLVLAQVGGQKTQSQRVDLGEMAVAIVAEHRLSAPERAPVEFICPQEWVVEGDPRLLRILLENLLSNAWKFTSKAPKARIEFGACRTGNQTVFFVRDNGVGFDMNYADKLFGPFQRLHSPDEFEGTGVGLATVRRIVHRHGGRVWARGGVNQGATFYFTLGQATEGNEHIIH